MSNFHVPIMLNEVIENLNVRDGGVFVDCTVGGAGHSLEIAKRCKTLIAFDRDQDAIDEASKVLAKFNAKLVKANFKDAPKILREMGIDKIDGFLVDLGISSHQIDEGERGFSFVRDGVLDMRMDRTENILTAKEIVNSFCEEELVRIFRTYGEEEFAVPIARNIAKTRKEREIETTFQLKEIIEHSMPAKVVFSRGGASKKVFQALRIFINGELDGLDTFLKEMIDLLAPHGRGCVLTFHSLEDRIVKNTFKLESTNCICPPKTPICICGHRASVKLVTRKPIVASEAEMKENSRSTSAKLRVVEKI